MISPLTATPFTPTAGSAPAVTKAGVSMQASPQTSPSSTTVQVSTKGRIAAAVDQQDLTSECRDVCANDASEADGLAVSLPKAEIRTAFSVQAGLVIAGAIYAVGAAYTLFGMSRNWDDAPWSSDQIEKMADDSMKMVDIRAEMGNPDFRGTAARRQFFVDQYNQINAAKWA